GGKPWASARRSRNHERRTGKPGAAVVSAYPVAVGVSTDDAPTFSCKHRRLAPFYLSEVTGMSAWPATRMTLLDRLRDPADRDAWVEFVSLYGPPLFHFARRRLPQDEDAADV